LNICAIAAYSDNDTSHISHAHEAIQLSNAASFLNADELVAICKENKIDAVHPGYGFLSESAKLASRLEECGITFIGPSVKSLKVAGSKKRARNLAEECGVPVLPALKSGSLHFSSVASFADAVGYPVMLKAEFGGGGRGIRLVQGFSELEEAFRRVQSESASERILAEKAVTEGWRHVEVQILGDGDTVRHFWERECSLQRR
jgi:acetyl/propionyl-CoA carboxylase alpha subunit